MHFSTTLALFAASVAATHPRLGRRDVKWGPIIAFRATSSEIISTTSKMYPGKMPPNQKGYLFAWIGVDGGNGKDLIQSVVGSYPAGQSECTGANADTTWCVTSEVYGPDSSGATTQFVGEKATADANYENGIIFEYRLKDTSSYSWTQTTTDAVTGDVLSTYTKVSKQKSTVWLTAVELLDANGTAATGTIEPQYYFNSTIVLAEADAKYGSTIFALSGGSYTTPKTTDGGKTWTIDEITVPAMSS